MLSFDLISTKMPFGRIQKPIERSEKHQVGLKKPHLESSSAYFNCFWPFLILELRDWF